MIELLLAVYRGDGDAVRFLLGAGADPNPVDRMTLQARRWARPKGLRPHRNRTHLEGLQSSSMK